MQKLKQGRHVEEKETVQGRRNDEDNNQNGIQILGSTRVRLHEKFLIKLCWKKPESELPHLGITNGDGVVCQQGVARQGPTWVDESGHE